jgi:hypothetical protein
MSEALALLGRSDAELRVHYPVELNLLGAKGIRDLDGLEIGSYCGLADHWAEAIRHRLAKHEQAFWRSQQDRGNDIHQLRLGVVCQFVHEELGIRYQEEQSDAQKVRYTDPDNPVRQRSVMDTPRRACGNLVMLHVSFGWPVSLAGWHCAVRFDNGEVGWNVEPWKGEGGFRVNPDAFYQMTCSLPISP